MKFGVLLLAVATLSSSLSLAQTSRSSRQRDAKLDPAYVAEFDAAMPRARVWSEPKVPVRDAKLDETRLADDGFRSDATVECRFKLEGVGGSTPKFVCELPSGDDFKVKYGVANEEVYTEVLTTRLFAALGFPADRMYPVASVRCAGCSPDPFKDLQCLNDGTPKEVCFPAIDYSKVTEFKHAVIERSVDGRRIETRKARGWDWKALAMVDPAAGGSPRSHVDALRLLAVFVGHWDNKAKNQRLLCAGDDEGQESKGSPDCAEPVAMVQDVGGTFGPPKLNLTNWASTPIWADRATCRISMRTLPYGGSTFPDMRISEEGRLFLSSLLQQLSREQIRALFAGARIAEYPHETASGRDVEQWVRAFERKVSAIANRPPCPR